MGQQDRATQLHVAAATGAIAQVRTLLAAGVAVDSVDDAGASPNVQAANEDTPWLLAGASGRTAILAAMIPHAPDLSIRNRFGGNALIPACEQGHVETVELLLKTPIQVDHVNRLGWTCLLEVVLLGDGGKRHQEVAQMVLSAGADPNLADGQGVTPLAHAVTRGQTEIAAIIRAAGGRMK